MKSIKKIMEKTGMRTRLILSFGIVLLTAMLGATFSINYYNRRFIRGLLEQNNAQKLKEINYEMDSLYDRINQIFLSLNNEPLYDIFKNQTGLSDFEKVRQQLLYEQEIKETLNANNLQKAVLGVILYLSEEQKLFVGNGVMQKDFPIKDTGWYQEFQKKGAGKLLYGPLAEDYRPDISTKKDAIYFMRAWYVPAYSGLYTDENPFILFSISMDSIEEIFLQYSENNRGFLITDEEGSLLSSSGLSGSQEENLLEIIQNNEESFQGTGTYLNREWFIARKSNYKYNWQIYSVESTENMFRDMNHVIRGINLLILLTGIAALILTVLFSRRIMMPVMLLNKLISTIEEENDTFIEVKGQDELAQIGSRFNQMKRKLQEMSATMYLSKVQEKEAQLSALQSQINPHFLYNTLDNIYCIAQIEEIDSITELTENLSAMMRYSMDMKNHTVPLEKELGHVQSYINILNIRFDNSITLKLRIQDGLAHALLLKLTLQPLVENAWNHGILLKPGHRGTIQIEVEQEGEDLMITVLDDGAGISWERSRELNQALAEIDYSAQQSKTGFGVALKNVNNRIKLSDGAQYGISLSPRKNGGCQVCMRMKRK